MKDRYSNAIDKGIENGYIWRGSDLIEIGIDHPEMAIQFLLDSGIEHGKVTWIHENDEVSKKHCEGKVLLGIYEFPRTQ